ncbi:fructose-2,6-bisphosphatase TIGAR [Sceloporus undulatus]|uniref:fructose-2,6-bisphosphatase TIGAR n=1 Tax=Sceloporus undulatus TaxID=8520 RepID=UPI001C4B9BDA|nr:fructose-2,6-bisphosphatase TIGAR [Sceloporus undulatus]
MAPLLSGAAWALTDLKPAKGPLLPYSYCSPPPPRDPEALPALRLGPRDVISLRRRRRVGSGRVAGSSWLSIAGGEREAAMVVFGLTVVRHGETKYNKEKILQGQGVDEPLSETGFRQASAAGTYLSNIRFTHVFSSDLLRAKQTTDSILRKNQFSKEISVNYDARLRERKYGVAEGKSLSNLKAMAKAVGEQCPSYTPPGGETLDEVKARCKDFFEYLCYFISHETCLEKQFSPSTERNDTELAGGSSTASLTNCYSRLEFHSDCIQANEVLDANILVVSHGAYMRNWIGYFISNLECTLPATVTKTDLSSVSPNTGISQFIIKLEMRKDMKPQIHCICLNREDHLASLSHENM